jgi:hypothetical protein
MLQAGRSWVENLMRSINFLNLLILPAGVDSSSNINEYQKQKKIVYAE